jgi:hypothetical protein
MLKLWVLDSYLLCSKIIVKLKAIPFKNFGDTNLPAKMKNKTCDADTTALGIKACFFLKIYYAHP